ncbi:hypothetical protein ACFWAT_12400 [Streptomyces syringium]|uniref:hypothetical protein n=1 Tax=Streptomyces syringium TaxID=76729 RepID=UPI0036506FF9
MKRLEELANLVLRDLSRDEAARSPTVSYLPADYEGYVEILIADGSGMTCGFTVNASASDHDLLYALADRIPDAYVELYAVGLPAVPGTHRPAVPAITNDVVVWTDPNNDDGWSCPVGEYP